jgi:DNA-3-methyladenine glycosylase
MIRPSLTLDFSMTPVDFAQALIGATLLLDGVGGVIVETEAYDITDPASHAFNGPTPRNGVMFGPVGRGYIYRSYGIHLCFNIVCGRQTGGAVLIRALEPTAGLTQMELRRGLAAPRLLCAGPGRLCQALGMSMAHNGLPVTEPPFALIARAETPPIAIGPRIGITKAVDLPWRFAWAGSRFLSRPLRAG